MPLQLPLATLREERELDQLVDVPGLGSRLSTFSSKKGLTNGGVVNTPPPIKLLSLASPSPCHLD